MGACVAENLHDYVLLSAPQQSRSPIEFVKVQIQVTELTALSWRIRSTSSMQGRRRNKDERIKFDPFPKLQYQVEGAIHEQERTQRKRWSIR